MPRGKKIRTLEDVLASVKDRKRRISLVLAGAEQEEALKSLDDARRQGIIKPVLVGDRRRVTRMAEKLGVSLKDTDVIDEPDQLEAAQKSVQLCRDGSAGILMKGTVSTDAILRAMLNRDTGLATGKLLSNVTVFKSPRYERLMFLSDPAVNISPDVGRKVEIIQNAITVAKRLGVSKPKVALLAATEKINKDMPATTDAAVIARMFESEPFEDAAVAGPYGLDIAVSEFAARCKNISGPVAGQADILICPDIDSANVLYKVLVYFAGLDVANTMLGTKVPTVMTSRSDSSLTKLYTIALAVMLAGDE
jgi:phosphate butyryltransferase